MKWIGQHIYDLVARFRNDVYLEDLSTTTETNVLVVDSDGKVSKTTVITGDVTGVTAGSNITVTDPTGPVPTVALNTSLTGLTSVTSTSFVGALTGNAATATKISSITNTDIVQLDASQTLTNKTLTAPTITGAGAIAGVFTGNITGNVTGNADTVTTNANLTGPVTSTGNTTAIANGAITNTMLANNQLTVGTTAISLGGTSTTLAGLASVTSTGFTGDLAGNASTATKATSINATANNTTNETTYITFVDGATGSQGIETDTDLTYNPSTNVLTAGTFAGALSGNADTVTTNADLTGPVTSEGNITAIANGAITTAMQKHLQTFEFNGYISSAASTNYFIPAILSNTTGPFNHNVDAGADGLTALAPAALSRSGGKVMPYAGTCKLWKGWVGVTGNAAFKVSIFKYTPVPDDATPDSLVLVNEFSDTALNNNSKLIAIDLTTGFTALSAGDILITGISCASGATAYFTSTLEVEWD
jgi:hypothetical protein